MNDTNYKFSVSIFLYSAPYLYNLISEKFTYEDDYILKCRGDSRYLKSLKLSTLFYYSEEILFKNESDATYFSLILNPKEDTGYDAF